MERTKLLIPIGSFHPAKAGGPSKTLYWHVNALDKSKFRTSVIATTTGLNSNYKPVNQKQITDYGDLIFCKTMVHYFPLRLLWETLKALKHTHLVHLTSVNYPPSFVINLVSYLLNKKIVWSIRGGLEESALKSGNRVLKRLINLILRVIKPSNVWYHATSESEKRQILKYLNPKNEIILLPNFMKLDIVQRKLEKEKFFFFLGRIDPIKSIEVFLEAAESSELFKNSKFQVIIAGNYQNEYGKLLKKIIQNFKINSRVKFIGRVDGERKRALLERAYCLFLPSKSENFGNVVIEALAYSTPVIASKGTPWEILEKVDAGCWVTRDSKSMKKAIEKMISISKEEYTLMCRNAEQLGEKYDISNGIKKWETEYMKVITS